MSDIATDPNSSDPYLLIVEARALEWPAVNLPSGGELVAAGEDTWRAFVGVVLTHFPEPPGLS